MFAVIGHKRKWTLSANCVNIVNCSYAASTLFKWNLVHFILMCMWMFRTAFQSVYSSWSSSQCLLSALPFRSSPAAVRTLSVLTISNSFATLSRRSSHASRSRSATLPHDVSQLYHCSIDSCLLPYCSSSGDYPDCSGSVELCSVALFRFYDCMHVMSLSCLQ